jgi:flagellar hook-basal body complex protein FliE
MNIEAINADAIAWPMPPALPQPAAGAADGAGFEQMVLDSVADLNTKMTMADQHLQALAAGQTENLHEAMLSMEQARLSFQFLAQVRNRFLDAYQQLMQMQI